MQNDELLSKYVSKGLPIPKGEGLDDIEKLALKFKLVEEIAGCVRVNKESTTDTADVKDRHRREPTPSTSNADLEEDEEEEADEEGEGEVEDVFTPPPI